jgi:hypothetical protein
MQPSIDINSYANPQQNNDLMNQLIKFKANRWSQPVQQANQGLNQGISNFNNNNIFARLMSQAGPSDVQGMAQQGQSNSALQKLMGGMGGSAGGGAAGGAASSDPLGLFAMMG